MKCAAEVARILGASMTPHGPAISPRGRGVGVGWSGQADVIQLSIRAAIDAGGVVGARVSRTGVTATSLEVLRSQYVSPLMLAVGDLLAMGEVYGRTVWRVDINLPRQGFTLTDAPRSTGRPFFASGELSSPPTFEDSAALTDSWVKEFAREMGVADYE